MSIPTDLYSHIMSYNFDYRVVATQVGCSTEYYFPRRIHKDFLFALQNGTDELSTSIIRDARKKLKTSLYIVENAFGLHWYDIPHEFVASMENGTLVFRSGNLPSESVTRQVYLHLKPSLKMTKRGMELVFDAPEQICIKQYGNMYQLSIDDSKIAQKYGSHFLLMCDWLFYFLVTGIDSGVCNISATPMEGRILKYASEGSINSSAVDRRNKRKTLREMLRLWKGKHPTLFGRMNIADVLRGICTYRNINLYNAMYNI